MYIDDGRSSAGAQAEATGGGAGLPARRLSRRRARAGGPHGRGRQGARRPGSPAARRRAAQARRQGLRLRAGAAVRHLPAHAVAPPQEAARGPHRRVRAPRPVGLLLRPSRRAGGAERMADLTIRELVRERYAAAAGQGCGCQEVFGEALYAEAETEDLPQSAVQASLGCGVPTAVAHRHEGETVLDLGSGAGADVLISARRVGQTGRAIGLDMTDEMLGLAPRTAAEAG